MFKGYILLAAYLVCQFAVVSGQTHIRIVVFDSAARKPIPSAGLYPQNSLYFSPANDSGMIDIYLSEKELNSLFQCKAFGYENSEPTIGRLFLHHDTIYLQPKSFYLPPYKVTVLQKRKYRIGIWKKRPTLLWHCKRGGSFAVPMAMPSKVAKYKITKLRFYIHEFRATDTIVLATRFQRIDTLNKPYKDFDGNLIGAVPGFALFDTTIYIYIDKARKYYEVDLTSYMFISTERAFFINFDWVKGYSLEDTLKGNKYSYIGLMRDYYRPCFILLRNNIEDVKKRPAWFAQNAWGEIPGQPYIAVEIEGYKPVSEGRQ